MTGIIDFDRVTLSSEQQDLFNRMMYFIQNRGSGGESGRVFVYHGLAGSGKTVVLASVARAVRQAVLCAFTGKATSILRAKTGLHATTLHSAIYFFRGLHEDEDGKMQPIFEAKGDAAKLESRIVLLDECSTVGARLATDLLSTGALVIACGDPGQLPPVRDAAFFNRPDAMLHEIHRQAWDSPIIRQAHSVRHNGFYQGDTDDFRVVQWASPNDIGDADIILCWTNNTRLQLNHLKRSGMGIAHMWPKAGEPLMCLRNDHERHIYNGAIYRVIEDSAPGEPLQIMNGDVPITLRRHTIEGFDPNFDILKNDDSFTPFAVAYAATVHKFQGSEENVVLLIDEYSRTDARREWAYTAITRAAKRIVVQRTY